MFRRGLSIALILGYAAAQMATIPHAHPGDSLHQYHASVPHIHLSWFGNTRHDHRHARNHHADHHSKGRGRTAPPFESGIVQFAPHDHDADAFYLLTSFAARQSTGASHATPASDKSRLTSDDAICVAFVIRHSSFVICHSPPDLSGSHCALILQLRTLRI
jgi:hypothetical protein